MLSTSSARPEKAPRRASLGTIEAAPHSKVDDASPRLPPSAAPPVSPAPSSAVPSPSAPTDAASVASTASAKPRSTANPEEIRPVDEDAGPKEFYHPASVEPQRVVWLPRDRLGLAAEEERAIRDAGILVSSEGAVMDDKGHVDISAAPPGQNVREKL